jgi:glycosyltransferase involved in cell wall biosynthesis
VILPALNEAATLPSVLGALSRAVPDCDVVVVDDGSTDDTAAVARACGAKVVILPFNLGIGGALRTGFRYAVENDYDAAIQLDADGQHDPEAIPVLLDALSHADFVVGSRFAATQMYQVGRTRRRAMRLLEFMMRILSGRTFTDTSSGFRAFGRPVLEYFARTYPSEYMESVEALLAANYEGFRIAEVPVEMHQRAGGAPSAVRFKLAYHYGRVMFTLMTRASRRRRTASVAGSAAGQHGSPGHSPAHAAPVTQREQTS